MLARNPIINLIKFPPGGVVTASPDGFYCKRIGHEVQVIIVGPMCCAPIEIAAAVNERFDIDFRIVKLSFLDNEDPNMNQVTIERGFVSIMLEAVKC